MYISSAERTFSIVELIENAISQNLIWKNILYLTVSCVKFKGHFLLSGHTAYPTMRKGAKFSKGVFTRGYFVVLKLRHCIHPQVNFCKVFFAVTHNIILLYIPCFICH